MPFAADTKIRICMVLELPITAPAYVEYVERALIDAQTYGGEPAVTLIEGYLTQYEAAQTALNTESANAGLIQADVLRWSETAKLKGYKDEMARLRMQIAKVLYLDNLTPNRTNRISIRRG
jgi:hypothetical protein